MAAIRAADANRISIHALREEGDLDKFPEEEQEETISIHALREEGDHVAFVPRVSAWQFLSTPSARRATISAAVDAHNGAEFLSTPSARRATLGIEFLRILQDISIHALREEGDSKNRDKISIFKQIIQHSARI